MPPTVTNPEAFASLLVTCSLKGTMFLLLVGMLALWTRSASCRHYVWVVGFVCLGALMLLDPFVPQWQVLPSWESATWVAAIKPWLLPVWFVGAFIFCAKVLLGLISLFRIERRSTKLSTDPWDSLVAECRQDLGIQRPVHLLRFPGRIMPMTWGVLRNFVVLPSSAARWSAQRVRAVLMHELAHIRRGDYIASLLRDAVCAFYWFHPLVWWAAREMDEDREEASDDAVLAAGQRPADYAGHLATIATRGLILDPQVRPKVALAEKPLLLRVRSILTPWKSRHPITGLQKLQLGTVLVLMLGSLLFVGPRQPAEMTAIAHQGTSMTGRPLSSGYVSLPMSNDGSAQPLEAVFGVDARSLNWSQDQMDQGASDHARTAESVVLLADNASSGGASLNDSALVMPVAEVSPSADTFTDLGEREEALWLLASPSYSTSPPDESEDGPETIDISEVMASLENVGLVAVNDFDLGGLGNETGDGSDGLLDDFNLDDFGADLGLFSTASLTSPQPQALVPNTTVKREPVIDSSLVGAKLPTTNKDAPSNTRPDSSRIAPTVSGQERPDAGLVTRIDLVTNIATGDDHLAITFRRRVGGPTASFRFEASTDLGNDNWAYGPELFALAQVRSVSGLPEATIVLNEPMSVSPFRFLRIRSSSPVPPAAPAAKE